jgi:hypothetical protein
MMSYAFDDRGIRWYTWGDFEYFVFAMLDVDVSQQIVDCILKFPPNQQTFLHRHLALTNTLVVQGEHRLYEPNGALKEVRPVAVTPRCGHCCGLQWSTAAPCVRVCTDKTLLVLRTRDLGSPFPGPHPIREHIAVHVVVAGQQCFAEAVTGRARPVVAHTTRPPQHLTASVGRYRLRRLCTVCSALLKEREETKP